MLNILSHKNSVLNQFLLEIRDVNIQTDRLRFRRNLERIGEIMAYEISKTFKYQTVEVETPLGKKETSVSCTNPVLITIVRAGIPFHQGFLNIFDNADNGFIAAFRHIRKSGEFEIRKQYENTPNLNGKVVIIADPMMATGRSLVLCCKDLLVQYQIEELHVASIIASEEGLQHIKAFVPSAKIWLGDLDDEMTSKSYIVPGLGDAGDLAYGEKE